MLRSILVPAFVWLLAGGALAQKKPVTLEALAGWGPPSRPREVVWSPDGKRFVYWEERRLKLYDVALRDKREIVAQSDLEALARKPPEPEAIEWENRRASEQSVQWSSSGEQLLVLAQSDLFLISLAGGKPEQLTQSSERERDPKLSPDGKSISFRLESDLYVMEIASRKITRLTHDGSGTIWNARVDWVYPEELDLGTAHWWSPDSQRIAYLQFDVSREPLFPHADWLAARAFPEPQRYPKAGDPNAEVRVGVVPASGGRTQWMDLGETRDHLLARVQWTPDSTGLAVQRLNRVQNRLDLLLADAQSGRASLLLREENPYWINVGDELRFLTRGGQFLWASERDGFRHLYLYSMEGALLRRLTRGNWQVTRVAGVDEARGRVYYVSTEPTPLEQHVYYAELSGNRHKRLSKAEGTHTVSMDPTASYYLDTVSNITSPSATLLRDAEGGELAVFAEADRSRLQEYEVLPTEIVTVPAPDGETLYARLIKPAGFDRSKKYPAIIMVYGGPHAQAVRNAWPTIGWDQVMAHRGFVIWQLDNRGSAHRGLKWESTVYRNLGAKELEDQLTGIRHLVSMGFVDESRLGIHGWSYGGYMTLFCLLKAPKVFSAGIAGAPVSDWRLYDTIYTERYMGLPAENEEGYRNSSPVNFAAQLEAKLMLIHNLGDDNVHFQNTVRMADALQKADKQFDLIFYPQKNHGVSGKTRAHMYRAMTDFFERHLKN